MIDNPPNPRDPFLIEKVPADILEWARQTFDEKDFLAQVREIEATGGYVLDDFLGELEARSRM